MKTTNSTHNPLTAATPPEGTPPAVPPDTTDGTGAPVRLALLEPTRGETATLDGAWWPRSRRLMDELPPLIVDLHRRGVQITRVAYRSESWEAAPRRLFADGRVVRLGWFPGLDRNLVRLTGGDGGQVRLDLLVVPPSLDEAAARLAIAAAAGRQNHSSATAVLASLGALSDGDHPTQYGAPAAGSRNVARPGSPESLTAEHQHGRGHTCPMCGSIPLPGGHCECSYTDIDAQNHPLRRPDQA